MRQAVTNQILKLHSCTAAELNVVLLDELHVCVISLVGQIWGSWKFVDWNIWRLNCKRFKLPKHSHGFLKVSGICSKTASQMHSHIMDCPGLSGHLKRYALWSRTWIYFYAPKPPKSCCAQLQTSVLSNPEARPFPAHANITPFLVASLWKSAIADTESHPSWSGCKVKWEAPQVSVSRQIHFAVAPACHHIKSDNCACILEEF